MDPACGTGGFLAEAFTHLEQQANTVEKRRVLQEQSIRGGEAKSLPYLLAHMNLLLHGLESPDIDPGNSLRFRLSEMGDKERVNVILTNPPFGGEEETGILTNFPEDRRATETALLFMQLIMRRLHRGGKGRAAVVVPNGFLFGDGIAARIKADLFSQFNLHTIVRLPEGVFAPYTQIPANLLFLDTSGATESIWFWEHQISDGRKKYSKTQPLQDDDLANCLIWWNNREEGPQAWKAAATDLIKRDGKGQIVAVNLDIKNPNSKEQIDHRSPPEIVESVIAKEQQVLTLLAEMRTLVEGREGYE
jgi:type I restriction enzyme M protein